MTSIVAVDVGLMSFLPERKNTAIFNTNKTKERKENFCNQEIKFTKVTKVSTFHLNSGK